MARADKVSAVAELTEQFQNSSGAVLTEYRGLTVAQLRELRGSLGETATFTVVKNTLTRIAVQQVGLEQQLAPLLSGPSAVTFVTGDVVETAKGLRDFARTNPLLVIKGGVLDGKALTPAEIIRLADLEPREVLLAKLAGALQATTARAAAAFAALPVQMAQLSEALRAKREAAEGPVPAPDAATASSDGDAAGSAAAASAPTADNDSDAAASAAAASAPDAGTADSDGDAAGSAAAASAPTADNDSDAAGSAAAASAPQAASDGAAAG